MQLVASGSALSYVDPSDGTTSINLPSTFQLTSYIPRYKTGDALDAPVTFWTSLADAAALAYSKGSNPAQPVAVSLTQALAAVDPLFSAHVSKPVAWNVRDIHPVLLTQPPTQSLRDVVYAAFPDVALNQMARDFAVRAGLTPGSAFNAPMLVDMLRQDVGDGLFDGNAGGVQLRTGGATPYAFTANTTRFDMAIALDAFVRGAQNKSGLGRSDLQNGSPKVYDNISLDQSLLYPSNQQPVPFDNMPPVVTFSVKFRAADGSTNNAPVGSSNLVAGLVTIEASAVDSSGVQSVIVDVGGTALTPAAGSTPSKFIATFQTTQDGPLTFTATATDRLANTGTTTTTVTVDNTRPTISIVHPQAGFYSSSYKVEAFANDNSALSSFTLQSPAGAVDGDSALNHINAEASAWTLSPSLADGPTTETFSGLRRREELRDGDADGDHRSDRAGSRGGRVGAGVQEHQHPLLLGDRRRRRWCRGEGGVRQERERSGGPGHLRRNAMELAAHSASALAGTPSRSGRRTSRRPRTPDRARPRRRN